MAHDLLWVFVYVTSIMWVLLEVTSSKGFFLHANGEERWTGTEDGGVKADWPEAVFLQF